MNKQVIELSFLSNRFFKWVSVNRMMRFVPQRILRAIELRFLSDRFLKWRKINFNLTPIIPNFNLSVCIIALMCVSVVNTAIAQPKICTDIHKILIQRQQGHEPKDFYIEYREQDGGDAYQGLDIDGDKINDLVVRICGFSVDAICRLEVNLSGGKSFDLTLEGEKFFLGRIKASIYVIVGETSDKEKEKHGKRRIYQVTKQAVELICSHF